jgi:signal transduction histidine kinase
VAHNGHHPRDTDRQLVDGFPSAGVLGDLDEGRLRQVLERWRLVSVGQLAGGLAHEINNPLFAILGTVEFMLEDAPPGSPLRDRLERIERAGLEIRGAVRALVDFAREPASERDAHSLMEICRRTVRLVRLATLAKLVEIVEIYPGAPVDVEGSSSQLTQILLALIVNAQQAQPDGGEVELVVERRGDEALVHVHDRGPGIDEADRERVFEPFFTTKGSQGAGGLGLSVALALARLQGGAIDVAGRAGGGATFTLRLPLAP